MTPGNSHEVSLGLADVAISPARSKATQASGALAEPFYLSARALLAFVFLLFIFSLACRPIVDPDFWWHLKTGQYLLQSRSIPHVDIFSAVFAGKEWITHEWLSEVFIFAVYRVAGFGGLVITFGFLITLAFALIYQRSRKRADHIYITGSAMVLGALAAAPTWGVRPQVFSFLFAAVFLKVLDDYQEERSKRSIWWLIPIMCLWANLHAGFAVGIVIISIVIVGNVLNGLLGRASRSSTWQKVRPLILVLVSSLAVIVLNPNTTRIYAYPFETLTSPAMMKFIEEWRSPNFHQAMFQPLALFIVALIAVLALSRRRIDSVQLLLLAGTSWGMLRSGRNVPFFVLVATPLLAEHSWIWMSSQRWGRWLKKPENRPSGASDKLKIALNLLLLVITPLALVAVRVQHTVAEQAGVEAEKFPQSAMQFVGTHHLPEPVYNEYHWGGYLIWKLYPNYRVFIDGRADVYGDKFFEEFMATHAGEPGWKENLRKYGVRTVLITPDSALASLLREDGSWDKVFEDPQAVIFINKSSTK